MLRRDGTLIPFAAFDGKRWSNTWPAPSTKDFEIPIDVNSVPKRWWGPTPALTEWQAWIATPPPEGGGSPRIIHVGQPVVSDVHCARQVVLRTDYRSLRAPPPPIEQPYPKDGLAVSPPRAIEQIAILLTDSAEATALVPELRDAFNRAEREMARAFHHPISQKDRERVEPQIEAVYAFGNGPRIYYVEAVRGYHPDPFKEDGCAIAFGTGWFLRDGSNVVRPLDMAVDLVSCSRYGATYMLPLGVIRVANRTFWIAQFSGWNHERFVVVEIKKASVEAVVNAFGGAC